MSEEQSDYAQAWRPENAGDKVNGRVVAITMGPDMGYGSYPIVTLETEYGDRAVHAFHQVLRTELARRRPSVGDELEVVYQGKRSPKSGNGNPFHVYRVVGGKEPEFNWDSELPEHERPIQSAIPIAPAPVPVQGSHLIPDPGPVAPPPTPPTVQEKAAESFGSEPPFLWEPPSWDAAKVVENR